MMIERRGKGSLLMVWVIYMMFWNMVVWCWFMVYWNFVVKSYFMMTMQIWM